MYGSGLFPADARRFCPAAAARRGAEGQIQTLPLQRLRRGACLSVCVYVLRSACIANETSEACGEGVRKREKLNKPLCVCFDR